MCNRETYTKKIQYWEPPNFLKSVENETLFVMQYKQWNKEITTTASATAKTMRVLLFCLSLYGKNTLKIIKRNKQQI